VNNLPHSAAQVNPGEVRKKSFGMPIRRPAAGFSRRDGLFPFAPVITAEQIQFYTGRYIIL
jgi:hypothetical protein